jgi:hypothetical protein
MNEEMTTDNLRRFDEHDGTAGIRWTTGAADVLVPLDGTAQAYDYVIVYGQPTVKHG